MHEQACLPKMRTWQVSIWEHTRSEQIKLIVLSCFQVHHKPTALFWWLHVALVNLKPVFRRTVKLANMRSLRKPLVLSSLSLHATRWIPLNHHTPRHVSTRSGRFLMFGFIFVTISNRVACTDNRENLRN